MTRQKKIQLKVSELLKEDATFFSCETPSEVELAIVKAIYAYEEILRLEHDGKNIRAGGTWKSIRNRGLVGAIENIVTTPNDTEGLKKLKNLGMLNLSYEQVVLDHSDSFTEDAIYAAKETLETVN
jgi:hypothetical protein